MNRLQDDYDPYAVEEPSDEEPALSRWAPGPPRPPASPRPPRLRTKVGPQPPDLLRFPGPFGYSGQRFGTLSHPAVVCGTPPGVLVRSCSHGGGRIEIGAGKGHSPYSGIKRKIQKP